MSELSVAVAPTRHEEAQLALDKLDAYQQALYAELPIPPPRYPDGVPLSQKVVPTCELPAEERSGLVPGLVRRGDVDPSLLLALLAREGEAAWDAERQVNKHTTHWAVCDTKPSYGFGKQKLVAWRVAAYLLLFLAALPTNLYYL
jgi:hypothetical protein